VERLEHVVDCSATKTNHAAEDRTLSPSVVAQLDQQGAAQDAEYAQLQRRMEAIERLVQRSEHDPLIRDILLAVGLA
jgi:hypothetical protein